MKKKMRQADLCMRQEQYSSRMFRTWPLALISTLMIMLSFACDGQPPQQVQSRTGERVVLPVLGMHCGSCENAISQQVMGCEGVSAVAASATEEQVVLWIRPGTDLDAIKSRIRSLGFTVKPDSAD